MSSLPYLNNDVLGRIIHFTKKEERAALLKTCKRFSYLVKKIDSIDLQLAFRLAKEVLLTDAPFRVACRDANRLISVISRHTLNPRVKLILNLFKIHVVKKEDYWNPRTTPKPAELLQENIYGLKLHPSKRDYFLKLNIILPPKQKLPEESVPAMDPSVEILSNAYSTQDPSHLQQAIALIDPAMTRYFKPLLDFYIASGRKDITNVLLQNGADPDVEYYIEGTAGNWVPLIRTFERFMLKNHFLEVPEEDYPGTLELLLKAGADIYKTVNWQRMEGVERVSFYSELIKHIHLVFCPESGFSINNTTANCLVITLIVLINHSTFPIDYSKILAIKNDRGITFMDTIAGSFPELYTLIERSCSR